MFKEVNGFFVPEKDQKCIDVVFTSLGDLQKALAYCKNNKVAVQAGGNFGVWPKALSKVFNTVYTFEPDQVNFSCLCRNIGDIQNIVKIQAALGDENKCVDLYRYENNAGAHYVAGAGIIPTFTIDSLALPACDLIVLDIEGYELKALRGAKKTIEAYGPVIHIEDKGLSDKYGSALGDAEKWLFNFGYVVKDRPARDVILVKA